MPGPQPSGLRCGKLTKKAFITGIAGFAGSHLAEHLLARGYEVSGASLPAGGTANIDHLLGEVRLFLGDLADREWLRQVLDEVQAGMQRESLFQVMGHVSQNYRDKAGRDYAGIREYLRQVFERYRNIRIVRTPPSVEIQGQYAKAVESFGAMADPADSSGLPINIQGQTVVLLERIDGDWKILEWGPLY